MQVHHNNMITIRRHYGYRVKDQWRPSNRDLKDSKDLLVLDVLAVITVWRNIDDNNNELEDIVNEVDDEREDLAEQSTI